VSAESVVAEVIAKVGIWWPSADESDLHAAAAAWDEFAAAVESAAGAAGAAARSVTDNNAGPATDAFATFWAQYDGGCSGYLPSTATAARNLAHACRDYADAVNDAKSRVREIAIEIGATLVAGAGLAVLTFGASQAAAGSIAAALVSRAAAIGIQLSARAAAIAGNTVALGAVGAVEAAAVDIAVAQPIRVELHDRGGYDFRQTLQGTALGGSFGGVLGIAGAVATLRAGRAAVPAVAGTRTNQTIVSPTATPATAGARSHLTARGDLFGKYAARAEPVDGYHDVIIHGSEHDFGASPSAWKHGENISHRVLARLLANDSTYTSGPIRLLSCSTGAENATAAQNLANKLGVDVLAPTDTLWAFPDGALVVGPLADLPTGEWTRFRPGGK
jgi:hypothetical protein